MWNKLTPGMTAMLEAWGEQTTESWVEPEPCRAEMPVEFLAGAQSSLDRGEHQDAAILAGHALGDVLKELCARNSVALPRKPSVQGMTAELAKNGVCDDVVGERLVWAADVWEQARQGQWSEFSAEDVEMMLREIREFMVKYQA
jgi:HEPN domain-containing protein